MRFLLTALALATVLGRLVRWQPRAEFLTRGNDQTPVFRGEPVADLPRRVRQRSGTRRLRGTASRSARTSAREATARACTRPGSGRARSVLGQNTGGCWRQRWGGHPRGRPNSSQRTALWRHHRRGCCTPHAHWLAQARRALTRASMQSRLVVWAVRGLGLYESV